MALTARQAANISPQDLMGYLGAAPVSDCSWDDAHRTAHRSMGALSIKSGSSSSSAPKDSGVVPATTSTNAPSAIANPVIQANNAIASVLAPFASIIDRLPNPPNYPGFTQDLKSRPVDAFVNLFTPLDWLIYDTINAANRISSVHAGSARRIGLPGRQIDYVMGLGVPAGVDPSVKAYTLRLQALQNFLILAYQDPVSLAKGLAEALKAAVLAGKITIQQQAEFITRLLQSAVAQGVTLFNGVNDPVNAPDLRFVNALADVLKSQFPGTQFLIDAKRAVDQAKAAAAAAAAAATAEAQRAANAAADSARAAAADLATVTPIATAWNTFVTTKIGLVPKNYQLAGEIERSGDTSIKNAADAIKVRAQAAVSQVIKASAKTLLNQIVADAEHVKTVASDLQGKKDNYKGGGRGTWLNAQALTLWGPSVVLLPTAFSGMRSFSGLGIFGVDDTIAAAGAAAAVYSGPTGATAVGTGGAAGVSTAPATTPGIGSLINQILGMFTGGAGAGIPGIGGGAAAVPSITQQPASVTVPQGSPATFTVVAQAPGASPVGPPAPLFYQWYKNGTAIPGATQASYVVQSAQPGAYGDDQYIVKVSLTANAPAAQTATSSPANLSIIGQPAAGGAKTKQESAFQKALPLILGAGAVVAFPVVGPAAAIALGVGAGAAALSNKKKKEGTTGAQVAPPGTNTIQGADLANAHLESLLAGLGDVRDIVRESGIVPQSSSLVTTKQQQQAAPTDNRNLKIAAGIAAGSALLYALL